MGRFCLESSLLPDMQGLRFSISSPLSLVCCAQKLFFSCFICFIQIVRLTVFITPLLFNCALCFQGCWWRCQFSLWFGIHPFLFYLTHVCELLEGFRQSWLRLAACSLVSGCFLFLSFSLAPFCILYQTDRGAG